MRTYGLSNEDYFVITVEIELNIPFPYQESMNILIEFCELWDSRIFSGSTQKRKAIISMPVHHFKTIFGKNPRIQTYEVPTGTEHFIESLKVKNINIE